MLHGDINPSNIFIDKTSKLKLKLTDFCLFSKFEIPDTLKLPYKAPELYFDHKCYTNKIDLWAVGCLLFHLLNLLYPKFNKLAW